MGNLTLSASGLFLMPRWILPAVIGSLLAVAPAASAQQALLKEGFRPDPYVVEVTAVGESAVSDIRLLPGVEVTDGVCTLGHFPRLASLSFSYEWVGGSNLYVYAEGEGLVLLVNMLYREQGPSLRCDDDGGRNPLVVIDGFRAAAGAIKLYVGTYAEGATTDATLYISSRDPRMRR